MCLQPEAPPAAVPLERLENAELKYFGQRAAQVHEHFEGALAIDDFIARTEIALCSQGFRGENSIACSNLCRDESTGFLKAKIDSLFGSSFNINGLGAVLTCGCTGVLPFETARSCVLAALHVESRQ